MSFGKLNRVVIADDHPLVLRGLKDLLSTEPDFKIVATCPDGEAALREIFEQEPEIALLDISMPKRSGLDILTLVIERGLQTKIVFLTATAHGKHALAAITHRAHGLVMKDAAADTLLECLREVAAGRRWISQEVVEAALHEEDHSISHLMSVVKGLSPREREVMHLVAEGLANKEIAEWLGMAEGTVKIHLHSIYEKTGLHNRTSLAAFAYHVEDGRDGPQTKF
jgi:DNA-binding NarL/FixJ family response regulator